MTPTITDGRPIMAFSTAVSAPRPGKRATATQAPTGRPITAPITTALPLTRSDSSTMSISRDSSWVSRAKASASVASISAAPTVHRAVEPRQQRFLRGPGSGDEPVGDDQRRQAHKGDAALAPENSVDLQLHIPVRDAVGGKPALQAPGRGLPQGGVELLRCARDVPHELAQRGCR